MPCSPSTTVPSAASVSPPAGDGAAAATLAATLPEALQNLLSAQCAEDCYRAHTAHARGKPARISCWQLLLALISQALAGSGSLVLHVFRMTRTEVSGAALAQRRRTAGWKVFSALMEAALRPLADVAQHPGAYFAGLLLVAIDGTEHSLANTPGVLARLKKAASRRGSAAFAKLRSCVLLELHAHNPLRAAAGIAGESELALARQLFAHIPGQALVLLDRLYGVPAVCRELQEALAGKGSHFLARVRANINAKVQRVLDDGSALITVAVPQKGVPRRRWAQMTLREIRGEVRRPGGASSTVRLWTTLTDTKKAPARELLALYAQRWEQELFYRELKSVLQGGGHLLRAREVESAAQELAALFIAAALLARSRSGTAAELGTGVPRVSLRRVLALVEPLWTILSLAGNILTPAQRSALVDEVQTLLAREALLPPRRSRSSPRAVRAPVSKWPRLLVRTEITGAPALKIIPAKSS